MSENCMKNNNMPCNLTIALHECKQDNKCFNCLYNSEHTINLINEYERLYFENKEFRQTILELHSKIKNLKTKVRLLKNEKFKKNF